MVIKVLAVIFGSASAVCGLACVLGWLHDYLCYWRYREMDVARKNMLAKSLFFSLLIIFAGIGMATAGIFSN